jgi:nicotinamide mononucleotide (NMN) deamidase PncC
MEHESDSDSCNSKMEDISVDECDTDICVSVVGIRGSDSDSSFDMQQTREWLEVKTSGLLCCI